MLWLTGPDQLNLLRHTQTNNDRLKVQELHQYPAYTGPVTVVTIAATVGPHLLVRENLNVLGDRREIR